MKSWSLFYLGGWELKVANRGFNLWGCFFVCLVAYLFVNKGPTGDSGIPLQWNVMSVTCYVLCPVPVAVQFTL